MADQSFIQVRVDNSIKQDATDVLNEIGIDMPNAIRMFLKRVILERGLPFETKLPENRIELTEDGRERSVEIIPAKPSLLVSMDEYLNLLCMVPAGKVTRAVDIEAYLAKLHGVERVTVEQSVIGYRPDIPFWRELSTRGMLQDDPFHCPKAQQQKKLEEEGLTIVPCGAYNKSLKVDNYRDHLFDFDILVDSNTEEKKTHHELKGEMCRYG